MLGIVILTKNNTNEFFNCLDSIKQYTHIDYKIFVGDTGSTKKIKKQTINKLKSLSINYKFIEYDFYSFTKNNNDIINNHFDDDIDLVLFCNNDVEIRNDSTVDHMVDVFKKNSLNVGTVGCRLLYQNNKIQHDGQLFILPKTKDDYLYMTHKLQYKSHKRNKRPKISKVHGNTFALALTSIKLFKDIGGLDESFIECFDDVKFNMECNLRGKINIIIEDKYWAYHHESLSRGKTAEAKRKLKIDYKKIYQFVMVNIKFDKNTKDDVIILNKVLYNIGTKSNWN